VDFGVGYFPTHDGMRPAAVARMVEERGQDALFIPDHTHIPAAVATRAGGALQRKYVHIYDQFVALAAAAAGTTTLRIGSGVTLVVERDPIVTAKEVASVDHLSGGRFEFGVGAGWNREEMRNHGTDPRTRMALMGERVEAMKRIWTRHEASYQGRFVSFDRIWSYPKPAQRPHPPILVGGLPRSWTGCWPTATAGCRTSPVSRCSTGSRRCGPARTGQSRSSSWTHRSTPRCSNAWRLPAYDGRTTGSRPARAASSSARWTSGRPRSGSSTASDAPPFSEDRR
jgi:hypothetical protein